MRLLRLWLALGGLAAGILCGYRHPRLLPGLLLLAGGGALLGFRRRRVVALAGIGLVAFAAGMLDATLHSGRTGAVSVLASGFMRCRIEARVLEDDGALGTIAAVERAWCPGLPPLSSPGKVVFDASLGASGSLVSAAGSFVPLRHDDFDLARTRAGAGALFDADVQRVRPPRSPPLALAAAIRRGLLDATQPLPAPERGLLRGLTMGDTTDLDPATIEDFRRAGLSHLLAVSGENLAMFLGVFALVIRKLNYRVRSLAYVAAIALFVLVVGPQPSVLRAAVMGAVMVAAVGRGHRAEPLSVLASALILVLGFRPQLVFSVGLQLSAAATAGIVLWTKPLERALRILPRHLALPLAVTVAAQGAVAPILIAAFGQLSLVSPLANLIAFPAVAPPTVLGLCAGVVSLLSPGAAHLLASIAAPFAGWIAWVAGSLAAAPLAAIDVPRGASWFLAFPLAGLAVAAARARQRITFES